MAVYNWFYGRCLEIRIIAMINELAIFLLFLGFSFLSSIGESNRKGIKAILVPTDFSESSDMALRIAMNLAKQQCAKVYLLHVQRFRLSGNEVAMMEKQVSKLSDTKSVEIAYEIRKGRIHEEILRIQKEKFIDLIVIPRHNKAESILAPFQNVTAKIRKQAQCSVLVVGA